MQYIAEVALVDSACTVTHEDYSSKPDCKLIELLNINRLEAAELVTNAV